MTTLGFLGAGAMGSGIAQRLIDAGHDLVIWNRSPKSIAPLVAAGARPAATPAEALKPDISFSMLANDAAVEAVLSSDAIGNRPDRVHVSMASISPTLADRLSEGFSDAESTYVSGCVLGRPAVAAAGELHVLVSGAENAIEAIRPYLDIIGKRTWLLGDRPSTANVVKAAVNYNIIHALQAIGESVAMTERQGVDPALFTQLLSSTLFADVVYTGYGDIISRRAYHPPGFTVALGRKDLELAEQVARVGGVTPASLPVLRSVFDAALADPSLRDGDWSVIAEVSRQGLSI